MTQLGVFARSFPAGPPATVARAIAQAGFECAQLNLSAIGRPTLDADLDPEVARDIRADFDRFGVDVWGVSGTFNMAHPDAQRRRREQTACEGLIARASALGARAVTLCSGTRDASDMWRAHPDNATPAAWGDMRTSLDGLLAAAADGGVMLGIEPESGNVVRDAAAASRLLHELGDDAQYVTIVLDPANLLSVETLADQEDIVSRAFDTLGAHVGCVHAKDVVADGSYSAPGAGGMDYQLVMRLHAGLPQDVPVIAQDLTANDAPRVAAFLRAAAAA